MSALVNDANALLAALTGAEVDGQAQQALALLALVAGQDVEPAEGSDGTDGRWRIARTGWCPLWIPRPGIPGIPGGLLLQIWRQISCGKLLNTNRSSRASSKCDAAAEYLAAMVSTTRAELGADLSGLGLIEDGAHHGGHPRLRRLGHLGEQVPQVGAQDDGWNCPSPWAPFAGADFCRSAAVICAVCRV